MLLVSAKTVQNKAMCYIFINSMKMQQVTDRSKKYKKGIVWGMEKNFTLSNSISW
jgi:hypothetical protein